jgi:hypothetical protein
MEKKVDRTDFKLKINIPNLEDFNVLSEESLSGEYNGELVIKNTNVKPTIVLKIIYPREEDLFRTLYQWMINNDYKILKHIQIIEINKPSSLVDLIFGDEKILSWKISDSKVYGNSYSQIEFTIPSVIKKYRSKENEDVICYLNDKAYRLIDPNYRYNLNFPAENESFNWTPSNLITDFISIHDFKFIPEFRFKHSDNQKFEIVITKNPRFKIAYSEQGYLEIRKRIRLICSLYSFYSQSVIDYDILRITTKDFLYVEVKSIDQDNSVHPYGIFSTDLNMNPVNLLGILNWQILIENSSTINKIIKQYILSYKMSGESRFMLLFSVLEQVRKLTIANSVKRKREEYKFITKNAKAKNSIIKDGLELIKQKIAPEHQNIFENNYNNMIGAIKYINMSNKFDDFFKIQDINPKDFGIDFNKLIRMRNLIFHGEILSSNEDVIFIEKINKGTKFPKFVGLSLLKYMGLKEFPKSCKY